MDHSGKLPRSREEVPEDLRCKRSDGKQWRCSALSMPDKTVCEKHYIQAKKRAANSALRASLKKAKRGVINDSAFNPDMSRSISPMNIDVKEKFGTRQDLYSSDAIGVKDTVIHGGSVRLNEEDHVGLLYNNSFLSKEVNISGGDGHVEYNWKISESKEAEGKTCHQCGTSECVNVWCVNCDQNGYCGNCISQWYADVPEDELRKICPACQGICSCKVCLSGDNLIKTKVKEISGIDKLRYLHSLLSYVLPFLKKIYSEQCFEIAVETKVHGLKTDIPRANINSDEQMCCNFCKIPIFDFHRHCPECFFDLCLTCCRDIRRASSITIDGNPSSENRIIDNHILNSNDEFFIDFSLLYPKWKANFDGSIPCAPEEAGGCGFSKLVLRRILKINWVAKLVKNAEEIVTGCKISDNHSSDKCESKESTLHHCSYRDDSSDNMLYCPTSEYLEKKGIRHFCRHWVKGEPVIIKHVFDHSLACSWDPVSIWRGIQETGDDRMPENNTIVKVTDYLNQSEVDIELTQFIKGYSEGLVNEDGSQKMLMLKDWSPPSAWEEFIFCQRPEFLTNLPLVEFIHSKWGLLNLAAKIPHDTMQIEVGPKIYISYGTHNELGRGDPTTSLHINVGDMVYLLMHSEEASIKGTHEPKRIEKISLEYDGEKPLPNECVSNSDLNLEVCIGHDAQPNALVNSDLNPEVCNGNDAQLKVLANSNLNLEVHEGNDSEPNVSVNSDLNLEVCNGNDAKPNCCAGATWDVFCRHDVPKLNEYFRVHWDELTTKSRQPVAHPIYEHTWYMNKHHIQKLKEEFGIEPWSFKQHVGEAVFVPAGCPFQVRSLQSTVQLGFDFLSPESLKESTKIAQEIRCLPDDHDAKLNMWEVGKITLYAASFAIREIQKIVLDPKMSSDINFEDTNLTAMVSENLEKMTKRKQIACT